MDKFIPGKNLHSDFIDSLIAMGGKSADNILMVLKKMEYLSILKEE